MELLLAILEFIFILIFQVLGIGFNVTQKVITLDKNHQELTMKQIYGKFFDNEWASLSVSILILFTHLMIHLVIMIWFPVITTSSYTVPWTQIQIPYIVMSFGTALVTGYGGQFLAYKWLGKAQEWITPKD